MKFHEDDRAQRYIDIFEAMPSGQINVFFVNSTDHVVAWHRHQIQFDRFCCLKGSFKLGSTDGVDDVRWHNLSDKNLTVLCIPPGVWHGYRALQPESILLCYMEQKYDPDDVEYCSVGSFDESWEIQSK